MADTIYKAQRTPTEIKTKIHAHAHMYIILKMLKTKELKKKN